MPKRSKLVGLQILLLVFFLGSCASNKAGVSSPELPPRHWLDEAPGVPVENRSKIEAAVPNLYDPEKSFNFEDCVFLTIQQSPALVNSAVEIEIKRLALTDAIWKYLPEPRLTLTVTSNLTRYNMDEKDTPGDYGRTQLRAGFYAPFPNPIATNFEHKAQKIMVNLAIATHRKAVGEAIRNIARAYLTLQAQRDILAAEQAMLPLGKDLITFWRQIEAIDGRQGVSLNMARQMQRESELTVEKTNMQETMDRTRLKILAGVEPQQRFNVDTSNASSEILGNFDGKKLRWEDRWSATEDDLLLRAQIKLSDYKIMVAWAQYIPDMSISINNNPPGGQSNPSSGAEDTFLHIGFDFPLIDWGRRYRGVQTARMQKAQAFHDMARKRTDYSNKWLDAEQKVSLAQTELKLAQTRFDTAKMKYTEAKIGFEEGTLEYPDLYQQESDMIQSRINLIQADLQYKLAMLDWMYIANVLQERFLGLPAKEFM